MGCIVSDTTCLIGLEKIDQLHLLAQLFQEVLVPPAVVHEFGSVPPGSRVEAPVSTPLVKALRLMADAGESEAIAPAYERNCRVILDDRKARSIARRMEVSIIGTIGVLTQARRVGIIPALKPLLDALQTHGFRVSTGLVEEALRIVGE